MDSVEVFKFTVPALVSLAELIFMLLVVNLDALLTEDLKIKVVELLF